MSTYTCNKKAPHELTQEEREKEWERIEYLVSKYQEQFQEDIEEEDIKESKEAARELLERFNPLFRKYMSLLRTGQIDFNDSETKLFVLSFVSDPSLKKALKRKKQKAEYRTEIYKTFNFIRETYGNLNEEEMLMDLQSILLIMAKRYKQVGKSFCAYIYNSYRYEVARHIKKFIKNPLNVPYKNVVYEDYMKTTTDQDVEDSFEDRFYENNIGMPDMTWVRGLTCSDTFTNLSPLERKVLVKYYLEDWNDRQISEEFGIHMNTVNSKRREAASKVAYTLGLTEEDIKRNRKSGKKAIKSHKS